MSDKKYFVQNISRALHVLFVFSAQRPEWTLEDLADELELNKTSLLRILHTLEHEGLLLRRENKYRLGSRVLDLANVYLSTLTLHGVARPYMTELVQTCRQTISLAILEETEVVYIAIEQAKQEIGIQSNVGGRHPAHATALGKILLSGLSNDDVQQRYEGITLSQLTYRTIVDFDQLIQCLEDVREQGYALDDEEHGIGIRCVAAPIHDGTGNVVASLSVAGPIFHMHEDVLPMYRKALQDVTKAISHDLGYRDTLAKLVTTP